MDPKRLKCFPKVGLAPGLCISHLTGLLPSPHPHHSHGPHCSETEDVLTLAPHSVGSPSNDFALYLTLIGVLILTPGLLSALKSIPITILIPFPELVPLFHPGTDILGCSYGSPPRTGSSPWLGSSTFKQSP